MDFVNLSISLGALVISLIALLFSKHQYTRESQIKIREELLMAVASFQKYRNIYDVMIRERKKTGNVVDEYEQEVLDDLEEFENKMKETEENIKRLLVRKRINIALEDLSHIRLTHHHAESMTQWAEFRYERFKRFNENQIQLLKDKVERLQEMAAQFMPNTSLQSTAQKPRGD